MGCVKYHKAQLRDQAHYINQEVITVPNDQKRSPYADIDTLSPTDRPTDSGSQWVGGRHRSTHPLPGGGGYQDVCNKNQSPLGQKKIERDPRLDELKDMGLAPHWIAIAEAIGVDNYMTTWQILDNAKHVEDVGSGLRVWVPRFRLFLRYQRNRVIQSMGNDGVNAKDIRIWLKKMLGEEVSVRHIVRVIASGHKQ